MMNKDEAVQKLATVGRLSMAHAEDLYDSFLPKPVVQQCVADWYEENKDGFETALYQEARYYEKNYEEGGWTDFQPSSTCTSLAMRSKKSLDIRLRLKELARLVVI